MKLRDNGYRLACTIFFELASLPSFFCTPPYPLFPRVLDLFLGFCKSHNSNISKNDTIQDSSIDYFQYYPKHNIQ